MKPFSSIILAILLISSHLVYSQVIITKSDTNQVKEEPVILHLKDYKGDIQWQKTEDQTNWQDISGADKDSLEIGITETMFYRARVTAGKCDPFFSEVTKLEVLEGPQINIFPSALSYQQGQTIEFTISASAEAGLMYFLLEDKIIKRLAGEFSSQYIYKYTIPENTPIGDLALTFYVEDRQFNTKNDSAIAIIHVSPAPIPTIKIYDSILNEVNDNIFGHFMEKCSWGNEIGGDLVINPNTGEFDPYVLDHLKSMSIPIIRYPGGTDVDFYDWTILIDNAPGQTERKPYRTFKDSNNNNIVSDNRLGLHEFIDLCTILGAEPLYVVNLGDVFYEKISLQKAKENAASLYAYCNMEKVDTGVDWPAYRKKNGHEGPFNLKYFQIGNETWGYKGFNWAYTSTNLELVQHLYDCITAIADTLKALNPDVQIIADGSCPQIIELLEKNNYKKIDYVVFHSYLPWDVENVTSDFNDPVSANEMTTEDTWYAWVSTPNIDSSGFSITRTTIATDATLGSKFDVAVTEWNWNGRYIGEFAKLTQPDLAKGLGAAGFLHGFMRNGDKIKIACQSMTVGKSWGITGIRVDPTYTQKAVTLPAGQVTGLYSSYHGNELIKTEYENIPTFSQKFQMRSIPIHSKVAYLDILTTKSAKQVFVHVINRSFDKDYNMVVNFKDFTVSNKYSRFSLIGSNTMKINNNNLKQTANIVEKEFENTSEILRVEVPHSSVSVFVFNMEE